MTDWRYFVTYSGKVRTENNDEDVARLAAAERHHELNQDESVIYLPHVEVEAIHSGPSDG